MKHQFVSLWSDYHLVPHTRREQNSISDVHINMGVRGADHLHFGSLSIQQYDDSQCEGVVNVIILVVVKVSSSCCPLALPGVNDTCGTSVNSGIRTNTLQKVGFNSQNT